MTMSSNPKKPRIILKHETCYCTESKIPGHIHCPCILCTGKPASRATAFRHCQRQSLVLTFSEKNDEKDLLRNNSLSLSETDLETTSSIDINENVDPITDDIADETSNAVTQAILEAFSLLDEVKGSQAYFMKLIDYGRQCYCRGDKNLENEWPKSWYQCIKWLEKIGYTEPVAYYPCLSEKHKSQWFIMNSFNQTCKLCSDLPSSELSFFYLQICQKLTKWFSSIEMCAKLLSHWREKHHWFNKDVNNVYFPMSELWDGKRFREISYFFDSTKLYMLPALCANCNTVFSVEKISKSPKLRDNYSMVVCDECQISQEIQWKYTYGSVEISIGNLKKRDRNRVDQIYVSTFIPVGALPKRKSFKYDPYLYPLIEELKSLYIDGLNIDYPYSYHDVTPGMTNIRCMLLLWTGDLPAQCEIGKFIFAGKKACRRDELTGSLDQVNNRYYYGNNRYLMRYPDRRRDMVKDFQIMKAIETEEKQSVKQEKSKESGYTGLSILHQLHLLYKFDVSRDLVIDVMHNLPLNVVRRQIERLVNDCDLCEAEVDIKLEKLSWIPELKDGRIPKKFSTRRSFWKAEEYMKFAFPLMETIIGGMISNKDFHLMQLLARMCELIFFRRDSWMESDVELFDALTKRFLVLLEEWNGLRECVITAHNLIHITDDVMRFGLTDNYWCWPFERCVSKYRSIASNQKSLELTFARAECRREAVMFSSIKVKDTEEVFINTANSTTSIESAKLIAQDASGKNLENGILIGAANGKLVLLDSQEQELLHSAFPDESFIHAVSIYRGVFMPTHGFDGVFYKNQEYAVASFSEKECIVQLEKFLSIQSSSNHALLKVLVFHFKRNCDPYSGYSRIDLSNNYIAFLQPQNLLRKVLLSIEDDEALVLDLYRPNLPLSPDDIVIPKYIRNDDFVQIECDDGYLFGRLFSIDVRRREAKIRFYEVVANTNILRATSLKPDKVSWDSVVEILNGSYNDSFETFEVSA